MVFPDKQNCYILLQFVFPACRNKWVDKWQLQKKTRVGQRERKLIWKWTLVSATEMEYDLTWGKVSDIYENKKVFWSLWWTFYSGHFLLASCDDDRLKGTVMNLGIIATKENGGRTKDLGIHSHPIEESWNALKPFQMTNLVATAKKFRRSSANPLMNSKFGLARLDSEKSIDWISTQITPCCLPAWKA